MDGGDELKEETSDIEMIRLNECPVPEMSRELCKAIIDLKSTLYNAIIFGENNINTNDAHDSKLLDIYCTSVRELSGVLIKSLRCVIESKQYEQFPELVRKDIKNISEQLCKEVKLLQSPVDVITYIDFIHTNLCIYPYVHKNIDS